ncbi:MAG: metallophosphoesterase [Nitrospinae bacterium]|nr:metallophosphoesterase [Nitrospinota bacterium]
MRSLILFIVGLFFLPAAVCAHEAESIKVVVVGDTGIGERAFHSGFVAVQNAMRREQADAILHLGDFVYQPEKFPKACDPKYIDEIKKTLVQPYAIRIFVAGDNDLPPQKWKPKASGCWDEIAPLATPFDRPAVQGPKPGTRAGVMHLETALFVVLDVSAWQDPTPWLKPVTDAARRKGLWIVFALHEPALTTAWYKEKRQTVLKQINALGPDLVLAGNQHSYERFYPMGIPQEDGSLPVVKQSKYTKGTGVTHVVSGGGGATFKPFADQQGKSKRTAPDAVFDALAKRALMFHYISLTISHDTLTAKTLRVCPPQPAPGEKQNPRWHADDAMWNNVALECDGKKMGVTLFDEFEIVR